MSDMPAQRPRCSRQDYCTPPAFLDAVKARLDIVEFSMDLAASEANKVVPWVHGYYDEEMNALTRVWKVGSGWNWCNPPYRDIKPWVQKAFNEAVQHGAKTAMLLPLSTSEWWHDWVHNIAHVLLLKGRITFVGCPTPYPKDCALLLYSPIVWGGYESWDWRTPRA